MKYLKDLWREHEERVIEAIIDGLVILKSAERLTRLKTIILDVQDGRSIEDKINRELLFCLRRANMRLLPKGRGINSNPQYEQRGQPNEQDLSPPSADYKRVDIRWGYFDKLAAMSGEHLADKYFCIECKRLGSPTSSNWKLNQNYVPHGIVRFVSEEHRYGQHTQSGAMIGYLEDMISDKIFQEINATIAQAKQNLPILVKIPPLSLQDDWSNNPINCLNHHLERAFPKSPFILWHFWLDLRNCYPRTRKQP